MPAVGTGLYISCPLDDSEPAPLAITLSLRYPLLRSRTDQKETTTMATSVRIRPTEATPVVISAKNYVPLKDDWYSLDGCVECVCGYSRYHAGEACRKCKSFEIGAYRVREEEQNLLTSTTAIKARFWYHATYRPDWDKEIKKAGITVHLGNRAAAEERMEHEYEGGNPSYTLYKVILNPLASISDVVCPDLVNGWSETLDAFRTNANADFVRYINATENIGTISLIGDPRKFIIVGKEISSIH